MSTTTPELRKVEPYEARDLPPIPADPTLDRAILDVATAVNGFPYPGERAEAVVGTIRWLRHNPVHAAVLLPSTGAGTPLYQAVDDALAEVSAGVLSGPALVDRLPAVLGAARRREVSA